MSYRYTFETKSKKRTMSCPLAVLGEGIALARRHVLKEYKVRSAFTSLDPSTGTLVQLLEVHGVIVGVCVQGSSSVNVYMLTMRSDTE
jgi:hypothetical protein